MTTNDSKDQGREAFEAWWEDDSVTFRHHESDPSGSHIDTAWQAWQAALATSASALASDAASQEPVTTQPKPVMWVILDRDGDLIAQSMTEIKGLDWQPLYAAPVPRQAEAVSGASALARDEAKELCARCNCWVRPSDDCNLCRSADDAKPVGEAVSVALTDDRIIDIWCNTPTTRFGGEVEDQEIIDFARALLAASQVAATAVVQDDRAAFEAWMNNRFPHSDTTGFASVMWLAWQARAASSVVNLEGLREKLLTPRATVRDEDGWLWHPDYPVCDEGTRADKFLEAFGIETAFVTMEGDAPDMAERWHEEGLSDCSEWMPKTPEGDGWLLLEIYDTEDGPCAMYGRDFYAAEKARKQESRRVAREERRAASSATPLTSDSDAGEQS